MSKVISFSNFKGGVGKSVSVCNTGSALAQQGLKVLLIDMDAQSNLSISLGIEDSEKSIYGAMKGEYRIDEAIIPINDNLDLIPAHLDMAAADIELGQEAGREMILKEVLEPIKRRYDAILIDTAPSMGLLTINSLVASDRVFIPLQSHYLAMRGLKKLEEIVGKVQKRLNPNLEIGGVFITQDTKTILAKDVAEAVAQAFGEKLCKTRIRTNIALAEAPASGQDIFRYNPKSIGAQDYFALSQEIIEKIK